MQHTIVIPIDKLPNGLEHGSIVITYEGPDTPRQSRLNRQIACVLQDDARKYSNYIRLTTIAFAVMDKYDAANPLTPSTPQSEIPNPQSNEDPR
jgi:hypothetical protein